VPPIDFTRRTALYRLFDADDSLLYVGIAFDPDSRMNAHRTTKTWWPQVARSTVEWHETRLAALTAEAHAIESEKPACNRLGVDLAQRAPKLPSGNGSKLKFVAIDDELWEAFGRACAAVGIKRSSAIRMHIHQRIAEFERKQRRIARDATAVNAEA